MILTKLIFSLSFVLCLFSERAFAFPELIRHGYVNCTACHISPTGGGVLSAYGRELSTEVLSTWGRVAENRFLYFIKNQENIHLGGDVRVLQYYRDTPTLREARVIWMQADIEAGYTYQKLTAVGSFGYNTDALSKNSPTGMISRKHYLTYQVSDEFSIRGGKYTPAFGINVADHVLSTKRNLRIGDQSTEFYALETAYLSEKYNFYLTGLFTQPDQAKEVRESGVAAQAAINFPNNLKAGLSFLQAYSDSSKRHLLGPFVIYGITPHLFYLGEFELQYKILRANQLSSSGYANYHKLGYEWFQGLINYASWDRYRENWSDAVGAYDKFGLGLQFFPRPHFEFNGLFEIQKQLSTQTTSDVASLMMHYYF